MTPAQRARIAREVTGHENYSMFDPGSDPLDWKQLVEWLADKLLTTPAKIRNLEETQELWATVGFYIWRQDIQALLQLAHDIMEAGE